MPTPRHISRCLATLVALCVIPLSACEFGKNPGEAGTDTIFTMMVPPTPAEAAQWAIDPYDADKRQRGILLLANAPFGGERPYLRLYELAIDDEDPTVRAVAVRALALHGGVKHAGAIADRLTTDTSVFARRESARALQRLHDPAVIPALMRAIDGRNEPDADVRAYAANALGQYAESRVAQSLVGALNDHRLAVNRSALDSLRVLTGEDFGLMTRRWLDWMRESPDVFAGRTTYEYPVFQRDPKIWELVLPFWAPPNEIAASPAGMPAESPRSFIQPPKTEPDPS